MVEGPFSVKVEPDWEAFRSCIMMEGTPERVHYIELFLDGEVKDEICERYGVTDHLDPGEEFYNLKREVAIQRFLGYDYVRQGVGNLNMPLNRSNIEDTADLKREGGRAYMEEHAGPITSWEDYENYPWPDPHETTTTALEWYEENLPEDMCIIGSGGFGHFAEYLTWLMGYESLCYSLYDQRDLVRAISDRLLDMYRIILGKILQFDRVKIVWGSDDMGYKTGTLISPDDTREFMLPGHKIMAQMSHEAGRPYILHSCGNLEAIIDDLIEDVQIDGKHSFEDVFETVIEAEEKYGDRIALLGGIDVDLLCRASEEEVRGKVCETLEACMPGGGFCLGTGNSVANYIPLDNYLAMLDEGRKWSP
ncbi:MAG: uroporphyrinogen decarboxylase family protein [Candidatus Brocadiia bacterium]